jgi:polyvinyl alcohol dehydrogenase (cytochrome)
LRHRFSRKNLAAAATAAALLVPAGFAGAARATTATPGSAPAAGAPAAGTPAACAEWAMFQHDPSHTGAGCAAITTSNVSTLVPGWFDQMPNAVTAEPAVVGNTVYVGDNGGIFHALDAASGKQKWSFDVTGYDHHSTSYGVITSSAAYTDAIAGLPPAVVFGGGGSVFALNASTGALLWHTDLAPSDPTGPDEVESSPVVVPHADGTGVVVVGLDTNESSGGASGGVVALNAQNGAPLWSFEPDPGTTSGGLPAGPGNGCNDVWSSPAVDPHALGKGLVFFGTGNCPDGQAEIEAISLAGGTPVWHFVEPPANHGIDDDFGSSAILASEGGLPVVVEGGKSGWVYVLDEYTGKLVNSAEVAQPGQTGNDLAGAVGGFIGAMALGPVNGDPVVFGNSAIPAPLSGDGVTSSGASPDTSLAGDPTRASGLHAYDIATGKVLWQEPLQGPSYAPVTYANGVLFAPSTTGFSIQAYDDATGTTLWACPLASSPSGGVAVVGSSIFFGTGTYESPQAQLPPQATGIWMFHLAGT